MTIPEKLKIIKQLSDLTQENLAKELGVSFATLNSWINSRSKPHKKKIERIEELFSSYAGITDIGEEKIAVKKEIIKKRSRKYKNILSLIISRIDIYDQLILSLTYNIIDL